MESIAPVTIRITTGPITIMMIMTTTIPTGTGNPGGITTMMISTWTG